MKKLYQYLLERKFFFLNLFIFFYIFINILDGERGYFSYVKKNELFEKKKIEQVSLNNTLNDFKLKNSMLSLPSLNLDYLDQLYREFFVLGKKGEKLYMIR
jgi:cell division protein DivIC